MVPRIWCDHSTIGFRCAPEPIDFRKCCCGNYGLWYCVALEVCKSVKLNLASWCLRKWHIARCVPEEARDNDGYLPSSLDEAGKTIYYVFKSYMNIRGHADGEREDADGEMEHIINHIKYAGWSTWYSSMMNRRAWLKSELGYE